MTLDSAHRNGKTKPFRSSSKTQEEEDPTLTSCGFGSWRPQWLQVFANPKAFLINICFVGIMQGMAGSLIYSNVNTLEKRFSFDSTIGSLIFTADNFAGLVLSPIVGYYGVRFNRSRLIGFGEIILALSCLATASPYFIYGPAKHLVEDASGSLTSLLGSNSTGSSFEMCQIGETSQACTDTHNTVWPAVIILFFANFFRGIGFTIYYIIAMPYMDDSVPKKSSPIYLSIMQCVMLIGPAIGFYFSAFCLKFYEDPWNDPGISRSDPRFVGAWWMGFLVTGVLLMIAAFPMLLFPAQFKGASVKAQTLKAKSAEDSTMAALKRFIQNPMILIYFLGNLFRYFGIGGFYMLMSKYIESQYRQSSSRASLILGTASVTPISVGIIIGGIFIAKVKPNARTLFTFVFLAELVSVFTIGSGIFLGCDPILLGGTSQTPGQMLSLNATCNSNCECSARVFTPICAPDQVTTYFSPCHAGCSSHNSLNSTFEQCACFEGVATQGYCPKDTECPKLNIFLAMLMIGTLISATAKTGNQLITYRTVDPVDKGFTNGVIGTLLSILTFIPSPIIYGQIADSSCLLWETKCGKRGNCWVYDQAKFRNTFLGVSISFMAVGSFFDLLLIFYSGRINNLYSDEEEPVEGPEKEGQEMQQRAIEEKTNHAS